VRPVANPHVLGLRSLATGALLPADFSRPMGLHEGLPVTFEYDLAAIAREGHVRAGQGIRRWGPLLPVDGMSDAFAAGVGDTPLALHERLGEPRGVALYLKHEGHNPSGSFKDRGLAVGVALGIACGAARACLPTQGNAGVAAALFSARAGLRGPIVYMPEAHRGGRYHLAAADFGAEVRFHGRHLGESGVRMRADLARELASGTYLDISTFVEPGRLEGKKTMGLEIAESFGAAQPDCIVYPTGGGTGLVGIGKAFDELAALGALPAGARMPRMIAVQAEGCAPVVRAFEAGADDVAPVTSEGTAALGLDVPATRMGRPILELLRRSGGGAIAVSEADMAAAQRELFAAGVSASLEGAATLAAVAPLLARGTIARGSRVLLLVTAGR
jgi:threonine synthase